jgi:hypothetical protein
MRAPHSGPGRPRAKTLVVVIGRSGARNQPHRQPGRAIGAVLDGDAEADQLVPKRIGPGEVPLGSGLVALGDQGLDLVVVDGHVGPIALTGSDSLLLKASGRCYRPGTSGEPVKLPALAGSSA